MIENVWMDLKAKSIWVEAIYSILGHNYGRLFIGNEIFDLKYLQIELLTLDTFQIER